jgi:hypothetical protein
MFSARQNSRLVKEYYKGYIPHVLVLDAHGEPLYNQAGEVDSRIMSPRKATQPKPKA